MAASIDEIIWRAVEAVGLLRGAIYDARWPKLRIRWKFESVPAVPQDFCLDFKKFGFDGRGATKPPQQVMPTEAPTRAPPRFRRSSPR